MGGRAQRDPVDGARARDRPRPARGHLRRGLDPAAAGDEAARLLAAAVPVHLALSLGWTFVLDRAGVRGARRGAVAGLAIAALDLGIAGRRFPRIRALPLAPQLADHVAFGAIAGPLAGQGRDAD